MLNLIDEPDYVLLLDSFFIVFLILYQPFFIGQLLKIRFANLFSLSKQSLCRTCKIIISFGFLQVSSYQPVLQRKTKRRLQVWVFGGHTSWRTSGTNFTPSGRLTLYSSTWHSFSLQVEVLECFHLSYCDLWLSWYREVPGQLFKRFDFFQIFMIFDQLLNYILADTHAEKVVGNRKFQENFETKEIFLYNLVIASKICHNLLSRVTHSLETYSLKLFVFYFCCSRNITQKTYPMRTIWFSLDSKR